MFGTSFGAARDRSDAQHVSLDVAADLPLVPADYSQVDQVVTNLLENAARHSTPGAPIEVTVAERDTALTVTVADHGPGIPADELPHVFERFWRGRGASGTAGSGVGLAVERPLRERPDQHDGDA